MWREVLKALLVFAVTIGATAAMRPIGLEAPPTFLAPGVPIYGAGAVLLEAVYLGPKVVGAWIQAAFTTYTLTTNRVYARTEFFSTDLKVIPYEKVTLIRLRRGLFDRLFGIAELRLHAYGAQEGLVRMRGLVEPRALFNGLRERIRVHNTVEAIVRSD